MSLADLIRKRPSVEFATAIPAIPATDGQGNTGTVARIATVAVATPRDDETDTLPDPAAEARRQRVLEMLAQHPGTRYAVLTDTEADRDAVIVALAIRGAMPDGGTVTCELAIPRAKYDGVLLLDLIEKHSGTVH